MKLRKLDTFIFFFKDCLFKYSSEEGNTERFSAKNGVRKTFTMTAMDESLFSPKTSNKFPNCMLLSCLDQCHVREVSYYLMSYLGFKV